MTDVKLTPAEEVLRSLVSFKDGAHGMPGPVANEPMEFRREKRYALEDAHASAWDQARELVTDLGREVIANG